jgi:hypothetical protein
MREQRGRMSDDLTDQEKAHVLLGLRNLVRDLICAKRTREEILYFLHRRGLKRETARAFLELYESSRPGLNESLDRNQEDALLRRLRAVVSANYDQ